MLCIQILTHNDLINKASFGFMAHSVCMRSILFLPLSVSSSCLSPLDTRLWHTKIQCTTEKVVFTHLFNVKDRALYNPFQTYTQWPNQLTRNGQKIWSETMVFSGQLRQFPQIIIALDKYTGSMITSSPNCMKSASVAMEIL